MRPAPEFAGVGHYGWSALTAGIILGSGGPIANWAGAAGGSGIGGKRLFITTAFCHCAAAQFIPDTPAGIFRHWSLLLAIVTLMLSLLGTLIVRSGILVSVHAFALDNVRAVPLFSLFVLISLASLALYGWRARDGGPAVRFQGYRGKC